MMPKINPCTAAWVIKCPTVTSNDTPDVFPRIFPLPIENDQALEHGHDEKQGQKDQPQAVSAPAEQFVEAEIKFHPPLPLNEGVACRYNRRVKEGPRRRCDSCACYTFRANTPSRVLCRRRSPCPSSLVAAPSSGLISHD